MMCTRNIVFEATLDSKSAEVRWTVLCVDLATTEEQSYLRPVSRDEFMKIVWSSNGTIQSAKERVVAMLFFRLGDAFRNYNKTRLVNHGRNLVSRRAGGQQCTADDTSFSFADLNIIARTLLVVGSFSQKDRMDPDMFGSGVRVEGSGSYYA